MTKHDFSIASRNAAPAKCSTCEALAQVPLACTDCHELLDHVQGADYFELFGMPRTYALDRDLLRQRYLAISRNIHPDRFGGRGEEMQAFALRASAAINRAHDVLADPLLRAEYLLESAGGLSASHDKRVPPALLGQVMMMREEIEEAKSSGDRAGLDAIKNQVLAQEQKAREQITALCDALSSDSEPARQELRSQLNAMKYYHNLLAQL